MLICDEDEPSPVSSDEVFFICEEQNNVKCDDKKNINDKINDKMKIEFYPRMQDMQNMQRFTNKSLKTDSTDDIKSTQKKIGNILGRKKNKKILCDASSCTTDDNNQNNEKIIIPNDNNDDTHETAHTILVKIQVENCSQCPDKSISVYSQDLNSKKINCTEQCKLKKSKTVAVQVNFNSIESAVESQCVKISKIRRCSRSSKFSQNSITSNNNKGKKINESIENNHEKSPVASASNQQSSDISKKNYLWRGKNFKSQSMTNKSSHEFTSCNNDDKNKKIPEKSYSVDRGSLKNKKKSQAISPMKKLNRSSLTIGSDKITINLSKYSPCASRLAASSKILGNNVNSSTTLSPDSPLHVVRPKSPGRLTEPIANNDTDSTDKTTLQASLSLNIDHFKKTHHTPRSRSVGDSCVTSPTSEATTTLSYSPTGTEILSLEEVGQQNSTNNDLSVSAPDLKLLNSDRLAIGGLVNPSKVNLETKC